MVADERFNQLFLNYKQLLKVNRQHLSKITTSTSEILALFMLT